MNKLLLFCFQEIGHNPVTQISSVASRREMGNKLDLQAIVSEFGSH